MMTSDSGLLFWATLYFYCISTQCLRLKPGRRYTDKLKVMLRSAEYAVSKCVAQICDK